MHITLTPAELSALEGILNRARSSADPTAAGENKSPDQLRADVREMVLEKAKTPRGRAVVTVLLEKYAVSRAGELAPDQLQPFLTDLGDSL